MLKSGTKSQDLPLPIALLLALGIGLLYLFIGPLKGIFTISEIELLFTQNERILITGLICFVLNTSWIGSTISRTLGLKKQGSRLHKLTGSKEKGKFSTLSIVFALAILTLSFLLIHISKYNELAITEGLLEFPTFLIQFTTLLDLNLAISIGIFSLYISRVYSASPKIKNENELQLSNRPTKSHSIYLGTEAIKNNEAKVQESNKWIELNERALNGNVLITGSIGSGKTASVMLPIVEQIIENFDLFPSILALDPKNNFNKDLKSILCKKDKCDRVLHLNLSKDITINPFYCPEPLKDASFIELAQMFRMAADNFTGEKGGQSVFWDDSAFNLLKNAVIFCGAIYGYMTMKEIYLTLIKASDGDNVLDLVSEMKQALDEKDFDKEETFNICCSIDYFGKEFVNLDHKLKTGVLATATVFLNMFQEYHANRIFCPPKDKLTIKSMNDVLDNGKILIFDIQKEGLAAPMATFVKLLYLQAVLDRTKESYQRPEEGLRSAIVLADEYQDIVSATGKGLSDASAMAKGRASKLIYIAASQSLSSLKSAIGSKEASDTLFQNFRTKIACHSSDLETINLFKSLVGEEEIEKTSHSVSELSQKAKRNYMMGGFDSENANISESISTSSRKEYTITAKDFTKLKTFEALGIVYDGINTNFKRICLKPYFLEKPNTTHNKVLSYLTAASILLFGLTTPFQNKAVAGLPNVCTVVNSADYGSCLGFKKSSCWCKSPWPLPPHPCARITYWVPQTFIEVHRESKKSYFKEMPGVMAQLNTLDDSEFKMPQAVNDDDGIYTYHAHTIQVPFSNWFNILSCGGTRPPKTCFDGMSEHLGMNWVTGTPDEWQPLFNTWKSNPAMCLMKGAATSTVGGGEAVQGNEGGCSVKMDWLAKYPPSSHSVCNGWGIHFPRTGRYHGSSTVAGALTIAARMKSLSSEVFRSLPSSPDEKWQMIYPNSSRCFREGQNMGFLEIAKKANERARFHNWKQQGFLFVIWKRVSCCVEYPYLPAVHGAMNVLKSVCRGNK